MTELALLARAFEAVREPDEVTIAAARARLHRLIADTSDQPTRRPRTIGRLRLVIVVLALLLLIAGIATATYLSLQTWWVSAGPRGIQHASDYRLETVFAPPDAIEERANFGARFKHWSAFALDPRGHDLYALHRPAGARIPQLVRIRGVDRGARLRATRVLGLEALAGPRFQPAWWPRSDRDSLAPAPNGDLFLLAWGRDPTTALRLPHGDAAVFVLHPTGARQRVLSLGELVESGMLPHLAAQAELSLAASAVDRLWLEALAFEVRRGYRRPVEGSRRLLEIVDPNADGDWSDRVVRPFVLPRSIQVRGLVAEPPRPGDDQARSVLATTAVSDGRFRVYRISDFDDDGDALGRGETRIDYDGRAGSSVTSVVVGSGSAARRALAFMGIHGFDRISLVTRSGAARDIARSFPAYIDSLLGGPNGEIYAVTQAGTAYRLASLGSRVRTGKPPAALSVPAAALPPTSGVAQILFSTPAPASVGIKDAQGPLYAVGVDGRGLRKLPHGAAQCFSRDGRMIAFRSDARVPYEPSAYVANADGTRVRKLPALPYWPFSTPVVRIRGATGSRRVRPPDRTYGRSASQGSILSDSVSRRNQSCLPREGTPERRVSGAAAEIDRGRRLDHGPPTLDRPAGADGFRLRESGGLDGRNRVVARRNANRLRDGSTTAPGRRPQARALRALGPRRPKQGGRLLHVDRGPDAAPAGRRTGRACWCAPRIETSIPTSAVSEGRLFHRSERCGSRPRARPRQAVGSIRPPRRTCAARVLGLGSVRWRIRVRDSAGAVPPDGRWAHQKAGLGARRPVARRGVVGLVTRRPLHRAQQRCAGHALEAPPAEDDRRPDRRDPCHPHARPLGLGIVVVTLRRAQE